MKKKSWSTILNQNFFIKYNQYNVQIYEIISKSQTKLLKKFGTETEITSIQFNTLVPNIIILSFINGICKIYNILNQNDKEDILFENANKEYILISLFNIFDPNIIATVTKDTISIWDIRKLYYLNILKTNYEIIDAKWSYYDKNHIEMEYKMDDKIKVKLIEVKEKNIIYSQEIPEELVNFLYLQKNILILIKENLIEKLNFGNDNDSKKTEKLFVEDILYSNEDLIKENNILSIISQEKIYFIDLLKFLIIQEIKFPFRFDYFFYVKSENEIGLQYSDLLGRLDENIFHINNHNLKLNNIKHLDNIKDNFYDRFCPKLLKYMCLLNFKDNETTQQISVKNYMNIQEINDFFERIKKINIFRRKDFIIQLFDYNLRNNQIINLNEELNLTKFLKIRNYIDLFKDKNIKQRKDIFISKIKAEINNNFIKDFYIEIIKLLTIDNTNEKLLEIYLLFLNLHEQKLINKYGENFIEKYVSELEYYSVCFSPEEYKILFNKEKEGEKELLFGFLDKAYNLKNFDFSDVDFKKFVHDLKDSTLEGFPDFNQPIEYDCNNDELKWYSIKEHIFISFLNIEINKKNKDDLQLMRIGLKTVQEKKLFKNENIINDKYKLQSVLYLIKNPFYHDYKDDSLDFFCNSILSESNNIDELKKKYKIIDDNKLEYENEIYDNIKDICIENLSNKNYSKEEKYNFNYLIKNYITNQDKIYQFLLNILKKRVFRDAYKILFGDEEYKLLDERYLNEFIKKRLNFVPIKPNGAGAISDKYSLNTFISIKNHDIIINNSNKIESENLKEILNTSNYILTEEHEIFHILNSIPYYENNCSISINTPRKNNYTYNGKEEGGIYLELLLFTKEIIKITLGDALFILNEDNYDKSLPEFIDCFQKKNKDDLIIKGVFSYFNDYFEISEISDAYFDKNLIKIKSNKNSDILSDYYIVKELKNDVAGKLYKK